jgi:4'-phosphopantetheinyl transferase EntD
MPYELADAQRAGAGRQAASAAAGLLGRLFGAHVAVRVALPGAYDAGLPPAEEACARTMVVERRREFTAGRVCARLALDDLGGPTGPIPRSPGGRADWPAGFVGSITHCSGFCCAVAAPASVLCGIGVDAEIAAPLDASVAHLVGGPDERRGWDGLASESVPDFGIVAFSIKEAIFKCLQSQGPAPLALTDIRFDVEERGAAAGAFRSRGPGQAARAVVRGFWIVRGGLVHTGAVWR